MQLNLLEKDNLHIIQRNSDSDRDIVNQMLSKHFLNKNEDYIEKIYQELKENSVVSIPDEVFRSVARVKAAFLDCLKLFEYEWVPNHEDLIDFTGGAVSDMDIANYESYNQSFTSLNDICVNDMDEKDLLYETIDNGEYEKTDNDDIVYESLNLLSLDEKELLMHRFGLGEYDELDIPDLSKLYAVSEEEIESRVNTALSHMKSVLETMM